MSNKWNVGFSKAVLTPSDCKETAYYLGGFDRGTRAKLVLDDIYVRSVYLSDRDNGMNGIVIASIDCIGICNKEINEIRNRVMRYLPEGSVRSVNIMCTHVHSAPDTQGLWGKGLSSGRNKEYMETLKALVSECICRSVRETRTGKIFYGKALTENMILDNRPPEIHDDNLVRMRFVPEDGSPELYILNIGCHPELLGKNQHKISADWPCYMGRRIHEVTGAEFAFFNGAIGAITSVGMGEVYSGLIDGESSMMEFGKKMGDYALSIQDEVEVEPFIDIFRVERILSVENRIFSLASILKVIKNDVIKVDAVRYKKAIKTEVSLLLLGSIKILLVPGELFPELALGGFFSSETSSTGTEYDYETLFDTLGDGEKLVFGLANDQIGYIIPDNDFYISEKKPYCFWAIPSDRHGREHYEETTCSGPYAAEMMRDAAEQLIRAYNAKYAKAQHDQAV